ncbi:hypothetical protein [Phenylobacterium sp. J367]|uniref:hypothetical protein n=1 Tax=Phenylobacterium sp. J367 TaxID=2898435 RepID=UPI002150A0E5|nr:hypothetical protein [Phenylobacterium sp. J367]MCR5881059.1 hypothetical protein [Phenylobacterium sp. J367]
MAQPSPIGLTWLQAPLDGLARGDRLALSRADAERLFGVDGPGEARIGDFAAGHRCRAEFAETLVLFVKSPLRRMSHG